MRLIAPLTQLFSQVSTSYKYLWFLAILELIEEKEGQVLSFHELFAEMVGKVWYPVHYFKLSFGKQDQLAQKAEEILQYAPDRFRIDMKPEDLKHELLQEEDGQIRKLLFHFQKEVPYRFLTPWLTSKPTNPDIARLSETFAADCLYAIELAGEKSIRINPSWQAYLFEHRKILMDYTYWQLLLYLQRRNPNVPDIASKLVKPAQRGSLTRQRKLWGIFLEKQEGWPCLYTNKPLHQKDFALDHFIPWSFLPHDQLWNLIPGDPSVNSSKSNQLPDLNRYLTRFSHTQQAALQVFLEAKQESRLLEDYLQLQLPPTDLIQLPEAEFRLRYEQLLAPLIQIATNTGFTPNWYHHADLPLS